MNDQGILEQLAQHPNSRAVQLADRLDIDLEDVQGSLAGLVAIGDVTATPGTSPAGNPCQFYDLSVTFKASEAYKPIAIKAGAAAFAAAHADLERVPRAVAFVLERGTASSYELHVVMGLKSGELATAHLVGAIADQRLARKGKDWTPGPALSKAIAQDAPVAAGAPAPQPAAAVESAPPITIPVLVSRGAVARLRKQAGGAANGQAKESSAPQAEPVYRCALWSDGIIEVRRDGETVAEIPQAAGESVAAFLRRLARAGSAA